jgi:predicted acyl esterase
MTRQQIDHPADSPDGSSKGSLNVRIESTVFVVERVSLIVASLLLILFAASVPSFAEIELDANGNLVEFTYATMSDGVRIALAVGYPKGFDPEDQAQKWPAILEMSGYPMATRPAEHEPYAGLYITVNASLRGTGASEGRFSVFSERSTRDGYEIIEEWIVKQPWSNGKVGIHGHSWSGLTGFRVAATNPPHLRAVVVSGLFDDAARGILLIGGIRNIGFPVKWASNFQRSDGVFGSDEAATESRKLTESDAREIQESRKTRNPVPEGRQVAERRAQPNTLRSLAGRIRAPIFILHAYQDEQTGPSGVWLFDHVSDDIPKRLLISNGHHGMPILFIPLRRAWFNFWLRGERSDVFPDIDNPKSRVQAFFEVQNRPENPNAPLLSSDFPLPETQWTRYYFNSANKLSTAPVIPEYGSDVDTYEVVSDATDDDLDRVEYRLAFDEPTAICGPITVTLWASCTAVDTDFFAVISDIAPDDRVRALQRGMLRASQRSLDEQMSTWVNVNGDRVLIRPYHTLRNPQPLEPGKPYLFEIEVFPVGHVFRAGHQLSLSISKPPLNDPVPYSKGKNGYKSGSYEYGSNQPNSTVTIHRGPDYPSSVLLPLLPSLPPISQSLPESIDKLWIQLQHKDGANNDEHAMLDNPPVTSVVRAYVR